MCQAYSKVIQLCRYVYMCAYVCVCVCIYIYIFFFRFFSIIVYYKILSIVPCAIQ